MNNGQCPTHQYGLLKEWLRLSGLFFYIPFACHPDKGGISAITAFSLIMIPRPK